MPIILAIETSLHGCSAAIQLADGSILERYEVKPREHAALILPMVVSLLQETKLNLSNVDAIAYACGPASFTGIRIAASVVQGLAFAHKIPVIPVSTLQTIAQTAQREHAIKSALIVLDAHMGEVYSGAYALDAEGKMCAIISDRLSRPDEVMFPELNADCYALGDGWAVYKEILAKRTGINAAVLMETLYPHARDVAWLANHYYAAGKTIDAAEALPIYLREKTAWKKY